MNSTRSWCVVVTSIVAAGAPGPVVRGGDLTPPPGPIAATDQMVLSQSTTPPPCTIATPGSYRVTSDLTGTGGPFVIQITAPDVTIDLNGFTIDGAGGTTQGIVVLNAGVVIRNGHVRDCVDEGVFSASDGTVLEGVTVRGCGRGINAGAGASLSRCIVQDVQSDGIRVDGSGVVADCTVIRAALISGWGITARDGSVVTGCTVRDSANGIQALRSTVVDGCAANSCLATGFQAESGSSVRDCVAQGNSTGIVVIESTVVDSVSSLNTQRGFEATIDSVVHQCQAIQNEGTGIWVGDRCTITDNTCTLNGLGGFGAGIETGGAVSRLTGNTVAQSFADNFLILGAQNTVFANVSSSPGPGGAQYTVVGSHDIAGITTAAGATVGTENIAN